MAGRAALENDLKKQMDKCVQKVVIALEAKASRRSTARTTD